MATTTTGRFDKLGFSNPAFWAALTGGFEIVCGLLLVVVLLVGAGSWSLDGKQGRA